MAKGPEDNSFSASSLDGWDDVKIQDDGYIRTAVSGGSRPKKQPKPDEAPPWGKLGEDQEPLTSGPKWAKSGGGYKRCYESHPPLPINVEGQTYFVRGGSCRNEPPEGTDIFVGFDAGMYLTPRRFPWTAGHEISFPIHDMGVPPDLKNFKLLIAWLSNAIMEGQKVYMGCIGGHGRTGLVLSALVHHMTGNLDSTTWVRTHYCHKAVESNTQVEWLYDHFGIKKVEGAKMGKSFSSSVHSPSAKKSYSTKSRTPSGTTRISHVRVTGSIHGDNLTN